MREQFKTNRKTGQWSSTSQRQHTAYVHDSMSQKVDMDQTFKGVYSLLVVWHASYVLYATFDVIITTSAVNKAYPSYDMR